MFTSETDAEVIAHLVAASRRRATSSRRSARAYAGLRGHYAFVAMTADEPGLLVGARKECPLIIGRGDGEQFIASAIPAFLRDTRRVQYIDNDEIVIVRPDGVEFQTADGEPLEREIDGDRLGRRDRREAGLRDVHAQGDPRAGRRRRRDDRRARGARRSASTSATSAGSTTSCCAGVRADRGRRLRHLLPRRLDRPLRDRGVGAGAGRGRHRLRVPLPQPRRRRRRPGHRDLPVGRDRRHAGRDADRARARRRVLALTNIMGSQATRDADGVLYTRAGLEIGVAATKTFVSQVAAMYLLALRLAELRGTLPRGERGELIPSSSACRT